MAQTKKRKKKTIAITHYNENLPTHERLLQGAVTIRNNVAQADEPLRIDKLLKNGIIDEMQHLYGLQIITLWTIASRPFIKGITYDQTRAGCTINFDYINISRMTAEDQFYKTIGFLKKRDHDLIYKICFDELGAIEAGKSLGLPVNSVTVYVRAAFDALGDALANMRNIKKAIENPEQTAQLAES